GTRLHNDFEGAGIRCWKWDHDARTGKSLWGEIDQAIRVHDKLVLIASETSLKSPAVNREIERAIRQEDERTSLKGQGEYAGDIDVLFPVRLGDFIFRFFRSICGCRDREGIGLEGKERTLGHSPGMMELPRFIDTGVPQDAHPDDPQSGGEIQVVRLRGSPPGGGGRRPGPGRADGVPKEQPAVLLGLRPPWPGVRPPGGAAVRVRAALGHRGLPGLSDAARRLPAVWGERRDGPLVRRQ